MKYEYVTFFKINGKWTEAGALPAAGAWGARTPMEALENRHSIIQGLGRSGYYGVECVTKIRKGDDKKDTKGLVAYFDFTLDGACGPLKMGVMNSRLRYREAVRQRAH